MSLPSLLINVLQLGSWPVPLRKPLALGLIKRKRLLSLPFRTRCHGLIFEGDAANMIDYHILSRGAFEPGLTELLNLWGRSQGPGIFLDVGANVGVHTLGTAGNFAKVMAIEPFPPLVQRLHQSLSMNGIRNVTVCQTALADASGTVSFQAPGTTNLGTGRILSGQPGPAGSTVLEVRVTTGDELLAPETLPLVALKIDTEGAEKKVLAGLSMILERDRPMTVFELLDGGEKTAGELIDLFPRDYRFYLLGGIKRSRFRLLPWTSGCGDIVAVPAEKIQPLLPFVH